MVSGAANCGLLSGVSGQPTQPPPATRLSTDSLQFGPFRLPADVDLLYEGETVVPLTPRAVRVLRYLAENRDRVVSKEEMLRHLWPDVVTMEGALKKAVSRARQALGDQEEAPRFIETHHGRGYRFIAPVTAPPRSGDPGVSAAFERPQPDYDQLVGRDGEMDTLMAECREAMEGSGRPVVILGEAGVGKTQLALHFRQWAERQGALCLYGRFFDYEGGRLVPFEAFGSLLRTALSAGPTASDGLLPDPWANLCASAQARCGVTLPEELFAYGGGATGGAPAAADAFRAILPLAQCLILLSRERPMVLILDDVQWADSGSLELLGYLMRTAQSEPLMLVALARIEDAQDDAHPLAAWLKRHAGYRSFVDLHLKPLDAGACLDAMQAVFGGPDRIEIGPDDLQRLFALTGGNPYFLSEVLRLLVVEGAIRSEGNADGWTCAGLGEIPLPGTVVLAARARLDRLTGDVRATVEQASVIGEEFRIATLSAMAGKDEDEVEELLDEAVRAGILDAKALSPGEDRRFHHSVLRRVVYQDIPPGRRRRLHGQAATAIEKIYAVELDRVANALSAHHEAAGEHRQALAWGLRAWRAAVERWAWRDALDAVERARRAASDIERAGSSLTDGERLDLHLALGESYRAAGKLKESEFVLDAAVALASRIGDAATRACALLQQGQTGIALGTYREASAAIGEAVELYRSMSDEDGRVRALVQLGAAQVAMGDYDVAARLLEAERTSLGSRAQDQTSGILGWAYLLQGLYADGIALLGRALEERQQAGDIRGKALVLRRLHWANLSRGEYETSIRLAYATREEFRRIGDFVGEGKAEMGMGQARIAQGVLEEGVRILERTLGKLRSCGDAHCEAEMLWLLGRGHAEVGRHAQAEALLSEALHGARRVEDRDDEFRILSDLARLKVDAGDPAVALEYAERAVGIAHELRSRDGLGVALVERARSLLALARPLHAREELETAVTLLEQTGSGERWRGYWALGLALRADGGLHALRRCEALLDSVREQLPAGDTVRRAAVTSARRRPVLDLQRALLRDGRMSEAADVAVRWALHSRP